MLNSMGMKEYLELLEVKLSTSKDDDPSREIELVDQYTKLVEENKTTVSSYGVLINIHAPSFRVFIVQREASKFG